jgi:hypothetical protein
MNNPNEQPLPQAEPDELDASDDASNPAVKRSSKGFFIINLCVINFIVNLGGGFAEVSAYVVLVRGSGKKRETSTHGANSVAARTGMTYTRAEKALDWLQKHKIIVKVDVTDEKPKNRLPRFRLLPLPVLRVKEVALANDLLDGVGRGKNNPPLARIFNEADMGRHCVIADTRLDVFMLLLCLYVHHDLSEFGGVDPRAGIYKEYESTENSYGKRMEPFEGTNLALFEIQPTYTISCGVFAREALFYVPDGQELKDRFICAFENLKRLGFLYETIQIYSADPCKNEKARPLYPLYIFDRHARESEPYLSTTIHKLALRRKILHGCDEFVDPDDDVTTENIIKTGRFRFVSDKTAGGHPIGIFRLRFRPHTRDTGKGVAAEQRRAAQWESMLSKL